MVDGQMIEDKLINAVAQEFGERWAAVKSAVLHRLKLDDEATEKKHGIWTRRARADRCDKYQLPGLNLLCHDERFCRFASGHSKPLRKHIDVGKYEIHWAREMPNEKRDVIDIYLNDELATPREYLEMDKKLNGGNVPERTVLNENVCFCLVRPKYDQCADPIYTQLRSNLPTWNKLRTVWHKAENSKCDDSCACKSFCEGTSSSSWFRDMSRSEKELNKNLLCEPVAHPELKPTSESAAPEVYKPCCTRGECDKPECLKVRLEKLRECKTEFADSDELVRYRKYCKMPRTRNDGSEYTEARHGARPPAHAPLALTFDLARVGRWSLCTSRRRAKSS